MKLDGSPAHPPRLDILEATNMMDKDPFGYPASTYISVVVLATVAAVVRYLNSMTRFSFSRLLIDALSGGFTGLLTFWLCESSNITGPLSGFLIGMGGLMGSKAWQEFAIILRTKFGLPSNPDLLSPPPSPPGEEERK